MFKNFCIVLSTFLLLLGLLSCSPKEPPRASSSNTSNSNPSEEAQTSEDDGFNSFDGTFEHNNKDIESTEVGTPVSLAVKGSRLFVTNLDGKIIVFDITDPANPNKVGEAPNAPFYSLASGPENVLYAVESTQLTRWDVSKDIPVLLEDIPSPEGPVYSILYDAKSSSFYEITSKNLDTFYVFAVKSDGTLGAFETKHFSLDPPTEPLEIYGLAVKDGIGYFTNIKSTKASTALIVRDLSSIDTPIPFDPTDPTLGDPGFTHSSKLLYIFVAGDGLLLYDNTGRLGLWDITDPRQPKFKQDLSDPANITGVIISMAVKGDYLYVAVPDKGKIFIYKIHS